MPVDLDGFEEFAEDLAELAGMDDEVEMWLGSAMAYAPYVEFGTGPHTSSEGHEQFVENLRDWCDTKGLPFFPIYMHIVQEGTEPHPHLRPGIEKARRNLGFGGVNVFLPGGVQRMVRHWALMAMRYTKEEAPVGVSGALRSSYAIGETRREMLSSSEQKAGGG